MTENNKTHFFVPSPASTHSPGPGNLWNLGYNDEFTLFYDSLPYYITFLHIIVVQVAKKQFRPLKNRREIARRMKPTRMDWEGEGYGEHEDGDANEEKKKDMLMG